MNLSSIAGVDEAGRGPLAGPVVAAAVVLPDDFPTSGLADSKKLTKKIRNYIFALIRAKAAAYAIGMIHSDEIDSLNILQATLKAMRTAVLELKVPLSEILIDGNQTIPGLSIPQKAMVGGDHLHPSIMAASILAKVTRDRWMEKAHREFPLYGFARHKGYGTASHLKALADHGPSPIHRRSFSPVRLAGDFA